MDGGAARCAARGRAGGVVAAVRRGRAFVLAALVLLGAGWAVAPRSALPLYDGVGFPDEPYRFVQPPAGAKHTKPPTSGSGQIAISGGSNASATVASSEQAPQVSLQIAAGVLGAPPGTTHVTITASPQTALPTAAGQYLWSNVYDVTATPSVTVRPRDLQTSITLRAATAQRPLPQIAYYAAGRWTPVATFSAGLDVYYAQLTRLGRFAVIGTAPVDVSKLAGSKGGSGAGSIGLFAGIGALVVLVALFLIGRRRRRSAGRNEEVEA